MKTLLMIVSALVVAVAPVSLKAAESMCCDCCKTGVCACAHCTCCDCETCKACQ